MVTTPTWLAATAGSVPQAGQINQFLGTHNTQLLYTATQISAQTTAGAAQNASQAGWTAQSITTGGAQTTIGYVSLNVSSIGTTSGANLLPSTISLYNSSAGAPAGSPIVSTTVPVEYYPPTTGAFINIPLPATGLSTGTPYWIVMPQVGSSSFHYDWFRNNVGSGASTSPNGLTWTSQGYGMLFKVFDQSAVTPLTATWEDSGARWTTMTYNATTGQLLTYNEYTAGQSTAGYVMSDRTLTYTSGLLTGVA